MLRSHSRNWTYSTRKQECENEWGGGGDFKVDRLPYINLICLHYVITLDYFGIQICVGSLQRSISSLVICVSYVQ